LNDAGGLLLAFHIDQADFERDDDFSRLGLLGYLEF